MEGHLDWTLISHIGMHGRTIREGLSPAATALVPISSQGNSSKSMNTMSRSSHQQTLREYQPRCHLSLSPSDRPVERR